jgi:hypothetical protein
MMRLVSMIVGPGLWTRRRYPGNFSGSAGRRRSTSPGWNCTPKTLPCSTAEANVFACVVGGRARARHRRRERVREVDLRSRVRAPRAVAPVFLNSSAFQPTCGIFRRCSGVAFEALDLSRAARRAPRTPGRLVAPLEQPLHADADAEAAACRPHGLGNRVAPRHLPAPAWREVAHAGHDESARRRAQPTDRAASRIPRRASSAPCAPT